MASFPETDKRCPSCEHGGARIFYRVEDVPVHSCVLLDSANEAEDFPRHRIELAYCPNCGFIFNAAFDPSRVDYTQPYEDQQAFSPTFDAFATDLARKLVDQYDLHQKTVVEIGCGKGDFLALLCRLGDNRGIGIDPALRSERIPRDVADRIECITDYFSSKYTHIHGDFICCRHTLEHIPNTLEFMRDIADLNNGHVGTPLFLEVPDTMRVLKELAFWDIYYEHCSYFTSDSLENLLRIAGLRVGNIELVYGEQYLLAYAENAADAGPKGAAAQRGAEEIRMAIKRFAFKVNEKIRSWLKRFEKYGKSRKRVAIWGSGSKAVAFLTTLGIPRPVGLIVDINPYRHGRFIPGAAMPIAPPEELRDYRPDAVVVMNPIYLPEITAELERMDLNPEILTP